MNCNICNYSFTLFNAPIGQYFTDSKGIKHNVKICNSCIDKYNSQEELENKLQEVGKIRIGRESWEAEEGQEDIRCKTNCKLFKSGCNGCKPFTTCLKWSDNRIH